MLAVSAAMLTTSCENGDREFDDFDRQAVYFAYQSPVRTITLGDDVYPTDLDNAHEFEVYATLGGVWKNKQDRKVEIAVDNSLCDGKTFEDGKPIVALPQNYYELESNQAVIEAGEIMGAVKVHLTDAFFNDPKAKEVHYVLPLKIVKADADFEVSGTGKWTRMGAPKAWGDKDRDLLELEYTAKFKNGAAYYKVSTKESLIMRDRQSKFETFNFK